MRKNVLITHNCITHYRIPFFNKLADEYNVTVLHSGEKSTNKEYQFNEIFVPVKRIGRLYFQKGILQEVNKEKYDVIIASFDVAWIYTIIALYKHNKKAKFILWGSWITANWLANQLRFFLAKRAFACIFYANGIKNDFINGGVPSTKLYVANNTFDVGDRVQSYKYPIKRRILFVGSLDKRKQNDILIEVFSQILIKIPPNISLTIIGEGNEKHYLKEISDKLKLNNNVEFLGKINDMNKSKEYYKEAIVSVSFGQAGLSVLQSFGYGVPYLTKKNAISGGEISNIKTEYNGILCEDNPISLSEKLVFLCNNIDYARKLGKNAYDYYSKFCTIDNMVRGFKDAIENTKFAIIDEC